MTSGLAQAVAARTRLARALRVVPAARLDAGRRLHDATRSSARTSTAIIDELGTLTFGEVHERTNALANAWLDAGLGEGDGVAIMCRNHRGFIEATVAASKLGAHALYLNTAFAGPQLTEVVQREKPAAIVYDQEFAELLEDAGKRRKRFIGWVDDDSPPDPTLEELIESGDTEAPVPPAEPGRVVILTSGTTGTPKGASRKHARRPQPGDRAPVADPAEGGRAHDDRRAALPLVGLRALHARPGAALHLRAAAQVRPGGDAVGDRAARVHVVPDGAGDAPADPRAARGRARQVRHLVAAHRARRRARRCPASSRSSSWTSSAT